PLFIKSQNSPALRLWSSFSTKACFLPMAPAMKFAKDFSLDEVHTDCDISAHCNKFETRTFIMRKKVAWPAKKLLAKSAISYTTSCKQFHMNLLLRRTLEFGSF